MVLHAGMSTYIQSVHGPGKRGKVRECATKFQKSGNSQGILLHKFILNQSDNPVV